MPTFRTGASGKNMFELQAHLRQLGYADVAPDGIFGPATETAVASFQYRHGLPADGRVDPRTRALIRSVKDFMEFGPRLLSSAGGWRSGAPKR